MRLDPKSLAEYFTRYFKEYRKYLDQKYPSRKNEFTLYKDYPYEINVYTDEKATRVFADYSKEFKVNVIEVGKVPGPSEGKGKLLHMVSNRYLSRILDKPENMAQLDVMSVFEHEETMEEEALREMEDAEKYYEEEMNQQVKRWFEIIEKTKEVEKATLEKRGKEVRTAILIAANQYSSFEIYEKIGHALLWYQRIYLTLWTLRYFSRLMGNIGLRWYCSEGGLRLCAWERIMIPCSKPRMPQRKVAFIKKFKNGLRDPNIINSKAKEVSFLNS